MSSSSVFVSPAAALANSTHDRQIDTLLPSVCVCVCVCEARVRKEQTHK